MAAVPLHTCKRTQFYNRLHIFFHSMAVIALMYYRTSRLLHHDVPVFSWGLMTMSELTFSLIWLLAQAFRWRPVTRSVFPDRIPAEVDLPGVDVFVCTADPTKEPTIEVMNTVLSAMALDYPPEKLGVYLSDDGGSSVTLYAMKQACMFARSWLPFCRKYGIKTRCPEAYFSSLGDADRRIRSDEFEADEETIKASYQAFKMSLAAAAECGGLEGCVVHDRPACVEVIHDDADKSDQAKMPLLVYVSREKRPSYPHRFKAGALNTLLRVSGVMSNGSYVLVLDCDMYCNDPTSAKQAMCFHLDPQLSKSLAFVQYPQIFYNVSKKDIYDGQARSAYKAKWQGMDGLRGPVFSGTGYYLNKRALYASPDQQAAFLDKPEATFGSSGQFIASLKGANKVGRRGKRISSSEAIIEEAKKLASCSYEMGTEWGREVGFSYESLLESTFTGYLMHCKGWKSVYLYPKRPCFLGCTPVDMKDAMLQLMKWASGLVQVTFSRFSPFTYGISRMSLLQTACYAYFTTFAFHSVSCLIYATVPQFGLLMGLPLFPKVSNPWFWLFATVYASSLLQHLNEVLSSGGSARTWWNEQRIWMIKSVTGCLFGCLDVVMKWVGITKANFRLTNKALDQEKLEKYEKGKFDFKGAQVFMVPLMILVIWNLFCFFGGMKRVICEGNLEEMFGQVFISSLMLVMSYPILEGLVPKKSKA
ncbi:Cellulose synthase (UDP-forming) [Bertholletia excelsa]